MNEATQDVVVIGQEPYLRNPLLYHIKKNMNEAIEITPTTATKIEWNMTAQTTQSAPSVDINYILSVQDSIRDKAKRFIKHIDSVVPNSKEKREAVEEIQSAVALCCTGLMNFYNTQKGTN